MALEPERPVEKLLRASAEKRRDEAGAPLELHPATRRLLHGEVARQFGQGRFESRSWRARWLRMWPRLAWGSAFLILLAGAAVWLLLPNSDPGQKGPLLARNEPVRSPSPAAPSPNVPPAASPQLIRQLESQTLASAEIPVTKTEGTVALDSSRMSPELRPGEPNAGAAQAAKPLFLSGDEKDKLAAPPFTAAPADGALPSLPLPLASQYAGAGRVIASGSARKVPASPAADTGVTVAANALFDRGKSNSPSALPSRAAEIAQSRPALTPVPGQGAGTFVSQHFVQTAKAPTATLRFADQTAATAGVLASFQVEQSGQDVRFIDDGDGSIYTGRLEVPAPVDSISHSNLQRSTRTRAVQPLPAPSTVVPSAATLAPAPTYLFRAVGTNRSLNQEIVFQGKLAGGIQATNSSRRTGSGAGAALTSLQSTPVGPALLPLSNLQISGKFTIGQGQTIEIKAVPTASR